MYFFCKFKKILYVFIASFLVTSSFLLFTQDGLKGQTKVLSDFVGGYIDQIFATGSRDINIADLSSQLQRKAEGLGLDLNFRADKPNNKSYIFNGFNRITNGKVCKVIINNFFVNDRCKSCEISVEFDPNGDGCIKSAQDGSLILNKPIETVFEKNNDNVSIVDLQKFNFNNKDIYKVIQYPSLCQIKQDGVFDGDENSCGYYAINNILMAYTGQTKVDQLLNRKNFGAFYNNLVSFNNGKTGSVANNEISKIIDKKLKNLCKNNVMISVENINIFNSISDQKIITFGAANFSQDRIADFQFNGTPQYLIVGTGSKSNQLVGINGLNLNWDNSFDRLLCVKEHWIVLKIEWKDKSRPGNCPVILSVFDSSGPKDNRFAKLIHWYYYVFTHTKVDEKIISNKGFFSDKFNKLKGVFSLFF